MELEHIVKRFTQKDALAFEQLYEMYYKSILGVVYNIVRDEAMAEEVTQDVDGKIELTLQGAVKISIVIFFMLLKFFITIFAAVIVGFNC